MGVSHTCPQAYRPIFSKGAGPFLPEKIVTATEKNCYATCKIALPDSLHRHHAIFIDKNPGFWALHVAGQNELRYFLFNKYKKEHFSFSTASA